MDESSYRPRIGLLKEKTLHAAVKDYIEPDRTCQEVPYLGFVADILNADGVTEVQTASFDRLRRKLDVFLPKGPVTIACPLPHSKWLRWLDPQSGELSPRRKSPKTGAAWDLFWELDRLRDYLTRPNLCFRILLLDMEEIRELNGWSRDRKRGSSRYERLPLSLFREVWLREADDWYQLLPPGLPSSFTAKELGQACRLSPRQTSAGLRVLTTTGVIERDGKRGRAYLYRVCPQNKAADSTANH